MQNGDVQQALKKIRCFALDMDGTFYLGNQLLDGSLEFLQKVRDTGRQFVFLTNNSSRSRKEYLEKLQKMGVKITSKEMVTSGQAMILYLREHYPGKSVYLLGNPVLEKEFREEGIVLSRTNPDLVVTAFDTTLDYEKLCEICDFVRAGLPYLATHPDFNCPTETGFVPDIGAIHAFIEASTGRTPDKVIGKPNAEIMECAFHQSGYGPKETAMVGDRLYTDIAVADQVPGLTSILVLTGETTREDLATSSVRPHLIFEGLKDITPLLD